MRLVFIGPPGAGKGTQAEKMVAAYRLAHLSTGDMLREARDARTEVGLRAEQYMSAGELVPDEIIMDVIAERLKGDECRRGFLLDGFPRTLPQADGLESMLATLGTPLDVVLELRVPEEELFRRLAGRGRADDRPETIRQRLVAYREQTEPLLAFYAERNLLRSVDGLGSVEEIFGRIREVLDPLVKTV